MTEGQACSHGRRDDVDSPVMKQISDGGLYQYLQSVQGYLAPPIMTKGQIRGRDQQPGSANDREIAGALPGCCVWREAISHGDGATGPASQVRQEELLRVRG